MTKTRIIALLILFGFLAGIGVIVEFRLRKRIDEHIANKIEEFTSEKKFSKLNTDTITLRYDPQNGEVVYGSEVANNVYSSNLLLKVVRNKKEFHYMNVFNNKNYIGVCESPTGVTGTCRLFNESILEKDSFIMYSSIIKRDFWLVLFIAFLASGVAVFAYIRKKDIEKDRLLALHLQAKQFSHDMQSPLSVLEKYIGLCDDIISEKMKKKLLKCVELIKKLVSKTLKDQHLSDGEGISFNVATVLQAVISEKLFLNDQRYKLSINLDIKEQDTFVKCNTISFQMVLSNLFNNAIESAGSTGEAIFIDVFCGVAEGMVYIKIIDNGAGFPEKVLSHYKSRSYTTKKSGHGIGVHTSWKFADRNKGALDLTNLKNGGALVELKLPAVNTPGWFIDKIKVSEGSSIVVCDNCESILELWEDSFKKIGIDIQGFIRPGDLISWMRSRVADVYIIDLDFGTDEIDGIELIDKHITSGFVILSTSHWSDERIINKCDELGLKLLPKQDLSHVALEISDSHPGISEIVMLDDEEINTFSTAEELEGLNLQFTSYNNIQSLFRELDKKDRDTTWFLIDLKIHEDGDGLIVGEKLKDMGYHNLFLYTGTRKSDISGYKEDVFKDHIYRTDAVKFKRLIARILEDTTASG